MNYYLTYYSDYYDRKNNHIRLEIYTTNNGLSEEVLLTSDAITVEYSQDTIFEPLKPSRASINLLVTDIKTNLFSGVLCGVMVKIFKNNSLFWYGYATPNVYSQPYQKHYDQLTVECVDSVALLGDVAYRYIDTTSSTSIFSFFDVIVSCIDKVDPNHTISKMYVDNSITYNGSGKILNNLYIQERNFFDEKEVAENCDEVVGNILKYLGLTLIQYKDAYYIISQSKVHTNSYNVIQYTYNNGWSAGTSTTLTLTPMTPSAIGIGESKGEIGLDGVYNKVTVIANNNPLSNILPDFDDGDDLVNQNSDPNKEYTESYSTDNINYTLLSAFFKSQSNWSYTQPAVEEVTLSNRDSISSGIFWQKVMSWKNEDGDPVKRSWKTYITMVGGGLSGIIPSLELRRTNTMIFDGGYLIVDMSYMFKTDYRAHGVVKSMYDSADTYGSCSGLSWTSNTSAIGSGQWPNDTMFRARMTIGDWYYNGEKWERIADQQARQSYYNSIYSGWGGDYSGRTNKWYRIKDTTHDLIDWEYVPESAYNSYSGVKESGDCKYANAHYLYNTNYGDTRVYIPDEFYYQYYYGDSFFLVHVNKDGETIYDTEYSLTNTVSYKMNIIDASEGMAIPCKNDEDVPMYGQIGFKVWACDKLGNNPQYRSDKASTTLKAIHISNLTLKYSKANAYKDIFSTATLDPDTIYSNKINDDYCKELEDINLKVNTVNDYATSYSYVIAKNGNDYLYIKTLNFGNGDRVPEERIVERMVNHYQTPKFQYGNTLKNRDRVTPFFPLLPTLNNQQKQMVVRDAAYDLMNDTVAVKAQEI